MVVTTPSKAKYQFINPALFAKTSAQVTNLNLAKEETIGSRQAIQIIGNLIQGNQNFAIQHASNSHRNSVRLSGVAQGRKPIAAVLNYANVPVDIEDLFGQKFGDLLVVNRPHSETNISDISAIENAVLMEGICAILVVGETRPQVSQKITYKIERLKLAIEQRCTPSNVDTLPDPRLEVRARIEKFKSSRILAKLARQGQIQIVGGLFDRQTGLVSMI
jgi:carbonic anhydrase